MMRKCLLVGDKPRYGGAIAPHDDFAPSVGGVKMALIGGLAHCEKCGHDGLIAKAGGPYRIGLNGREGALEDDVLLCHCIVPPKIKSTNGISFIPKNDDRVESLGSISFDHHGFVDYLNESKNSKAEGDDFVQYFEFVFDDACSAEMRYAIHSPDGILHEGWLEKGKTTELPIASPLKMIAWASRK